MKLSFTVEVDIGTGIKTNATHTNTCGCNEKRLEEQLGEPNIHIS